MASESFPPLPLERWRGTRDALQRLAAVISRVRSAATPPLAHYGHVSLFLGPRGITTGAVAASDLLFEAQLDLIAHEALLMGGDGHSWSAPLAGLAQVDLLAALTAELATMGIALEVPAADYADTQRDGYVAADAQQYLRGLTSVDLGLRGLAAAATTGRCGRRELWAHHFDYAMLWLSGRLVPGQDPNDLDQAAEQVNFGFSTGDQTIAEPYLYITAYPPPPEFTSIELPSPAYWHSADFTAAVLPYQGLVDAERPRLLLGSFLGDVQRFCAQSMV